MSLQGPILIVAKEPDCGLAQAFIDAGAFPVLETSWVDAASAAGKIKPAAIVLDAAGSADQQAALARQIENAAPFLPVITRLGDDHAPRLPDALTISENAPVEQLLARVAAGLRLRTLHATMLGRAKSLREERNIVAELADGDPLDDATVLLIGRGRHHATLSVAVGERMGVMGALSVEQGARCLTARELDGIIIGDGLATYSVDTFLTVLAEDTRFRDLPMAVLGDTADRPNLPNFIRARDPQILVARAIPAIRMRAREVALNRLLKSIECKGMLDADTGLFNARAFADALSHAIDDCGERGARLSLARFSFEETLDRRTSMDAARLVSRLVRNSDFACRQDDGSILFVFGDTDLRDAHVAARRLASVLRHTMLRSDRERPSPSVTLATLKPADTAHTLLARVVTRPVAAA
jgi:GGDEF domain-containing protein